MAFSWKSGIRKLGILSIIGLSWAIAFSDDCAFAQITADDTLGGENSVVTPLDTLGFPVDGIEGGATRGANLFHSFQQFSVLTGRGAYFNNPLGIENIISRVTGTSASDINGFIQANGSANLFLLNPNGIIFGSGASLDIGGSFLATTANSLLFADGSIFGATAPQTTPLLTVSLPTGLQFGASPRNITTNSNILQVQNGKTLTLVGGDVTLDGSNLFAAGGRVELAGITQGIVGLNIDGNDVSLNYPTEVQRADIIFTNNSAISVGGSGGGNITVYARNLDILEQSQLFGGILSTQGAVDAQAGDITLNATGNIVIAGKDNSSSTPSTIFNTIDVGAVGQGGDINIIADSLSLNGARLNLNSSGQGNVGSLFIQVENSASFVDSDIFSDVSEDATGNAGNVTIQAESVFFNETNLNTNTNGQGNAGNVAIQAANSVSIESSLIESEVDSGGIGEAGDINIQAGLLSLANNSALSTSTRGQGDAGSIFIQSNDVVLDNSRIASSNLGIIRLMDGTEAPVALGNAGNIQIVTGSLTLNNNSDLFARTFGLGNAGDVFINASGAVSLAGSSGVSTDVFGGKAPGFEGASGEVIDIIGTEAAGTGGDINIDAQALSLSDKSRLIASTSGLGNAGNVSIQTSGAVTFTNDSGIVSGVINSNSLGLVGPEAVGQGGNLSIVADSVNIDFSRLITSSVGEGDAGVIFVQANSIFLSNYGRITSAVQQSGIGNAGDINLETNSLYLTNGSQIRAAVEREQNNFPGGQGEGGNILINASVSVDLAGVNTTNGISSTISTSTNRGARGTAGNIIVNTNNFSIADGAVVSALTVNSSNAGSITINANNFTATGGGQVITTTTSSGSAGSINLNIANNVDIRGSDPTFAFRQAQFGTDIVTNQSDSSGLFANTALGSTGGGGSVFINAQKLNIAQGAGVTVDSRGQGNAGNLQVTANSISLDGGAFILASTASGEGGNIDIQAQELVLLRRNSNINAEARGTGNGGNINLDTTFIVALATEDSNIIADAIAGNGGDINITAQNIFGITPSSEQTANSDITASSELGIDGEVAITNPDVDPSQGLVTLPVEVIEASNQIAAGCTNDRGATPNKFIVTGRGGLPPDPGNPLSNDTVLTDWATETSNVRDRISTNKQPPAEIVEAQGWMMDSHGRVVLTAQVPQVTPNSSKLTANSCNGL